MKKIFFRQSNIVNFNHQQKKISQHLRLIIQLRAHWVHLIAAGLVLAPSIGSSQTWVPDSQYTNQPALETVQASSAYLKGITGQGVRIGIIDTGINPNNLAFSGALYGGYNSLTGLTGTSNLADLNPTLPVGSPNAYHGSFVSSEMVAQRGNGGYFQGIAYGAKLVVGAVDINGGFTDAQMAKTLEYITSQGVKVINNSWVAGTNDFIALEAIYPLTSIALQQAASSAVIVFTAGNKSAANPNLPATLPDFVPEIRGSWIVVAASSISGQNFAPYSNFCGSTMKYCLLAPGGITNPGPVYDGGITGINGASNSNTIAGVTYAEGTSQAAPLVSGAVALVAEVFPWMTAPQLATTILTTASNAAIPDAIIGRGMLRIGAAIQGPAILETSFNANTGGYSSTFSNNISGLADLIKSGEGTLILTGANTYSGGTTVSGGTLQGNTTSLQGNILNNSAVVFDQPNTGTYAGLMSGTGSLTKQNAGTLILTAANTYSGGTIVSAGTLQGNTTSLQGKILHKGILIFDQPGAGTFAGTISGSGAVVMQNASNILLSGNNTYSGRTTVSSGTLTLAGNAPTGTGDVFILPNATIMGTGTIGGNLFVSGRLKPGHSPGYLATRANVTMASGSVYQQDISGTMQSSPASPVGATGYYSYLNILGGQFVIQPGSTLTPALSNLFNVSESGYGSTIYTPVLGDRFRIVTADGGIAGKFTKLTQPAELTAGTQFLPFYNMLGSNSLDLTIIPLSYAATLAGSNANTRSVSTALDKMVIAAQANISTTTQDQLLYATAAQRAASLPSYTQGLAGEIYGATLAVVPQTTQRVQQAVMSRLVDTPATLGMAGVMNPAVNNIAIAGQAPLANVSSNPSLNPSDNVSNATLNNGAAWGEIAYQRGNRSSDDNASGFSSNLYQLVFGVDAYSQDGIKLGGGLALSNTNVTANQGTGTVQQSALFLYGKLPIESFMLDGMASYGINTTDHSRSDLTGLGNGFKTKGIQGNDALLSIGLSRPVDLDDLRITPYLRGTWQMVNQSSFTEGSSPAALSVDGYNGNGVRGVLGVALGSKATHPMNERFTYRVNVGVGADSSNLLNPTLNASLAGFPTSITTPQAGSTFVQAGLYGTVKFADNAYAYAGMAGEFRNGSTLGNVSFGVRVQF